MKTGDTITYRGETCHVRCVLAHPDGSKSVKLAPAREPQQPRRGIFARLFRK